MILEHLTLDHYRNYAHLDVRFDGGVIVLEGKNAQGKTNLLEAIYLLATTKSSRTRSDVDLITWGDADPFALSPFARITAHVRREKGPVDLEIVVQDASDSLRTKPSDEPSSARKRFKMNGVPRRAGEILGQVNAVFFAPTDVDIVDGSPSVRRRFLDIILCQVQPSYYRALQQYNKVLVQRNSLLRQIRDRQQSADMLGFWNGKLVEFGSLLIASRIRTLHSLATSAAEIHARLSDGQEKLVATYQSSVPVNGGSIQQAFVEVLAQQAAREIAAGSSIVGPHRDDVLLQINEVDATQFGSRGQQRSIALALKIAEMEFIKQETNEWPILLLDDATAELDASRRAAMLSLMKDQPQVLIATAEPDQIVNLLPSTTQLWHIKAGTITK